MSKRIRTIGGSGGGQGPGTAATVKVGPDYGTTNEKVELHLSHPQETVQYPMTLEGHVQHSQEQQTYPMSPGGQLEMHIGSVEQATYPMNPGGQLELHLSQLKECGTYPMSPGGQLEGHVQHSQEKATYPMNPGGNLEMHISGSVNGPPQFENSFTVGSTASSAAAFTGITTLIGAYLLAGVYTAGGAGTTQTPPAGWTEILNTTNLSGTTGCKVGTWYRFVQAGDPSSWTFNTNSPSGVVCGIIGQFSAVDSGAPINASGKSTGETTAAVAASVTVPNPNCMVVGVAGFTHTVTGPVFAAVSPYTQRATSTGAITGVTGGIEMCTHVQMTSGASGTMTVNTGESVAGLWTAQIIALHSTVRVIA